ncbi:Lsa36 family surface (lipo)protein [Peredibacter sp. HCB2-198]|uniref:Lsa36 family surface (lipo)protein n=1 Tax=Peredibacter sp. HCB2-198 TaxID=3383025 RepID=UPI0038B4A8CC
MSRLLILICILISFEVQAQIFQLKVTDYDGLDSINAVKIFIDSEVMKIEDSVNKEFPNETPRRILQGMGDANIMAAKGIGTDYTSAMQVSVIGATLGAGADFEQEKHTKSETSGYAAAPGLMIGVNLGALGMNDILNMESDKLNMYVNAMSTKYIQSLDDENDRTLVGLDMTSIGLHFRYHLVDRSEQHPRWGGLKFTWGYEYNHSDYTYETRLDRMINIIGDNELLQGRLTGTPKALVKVRTHSFPLAVSTDYQLLSFLNVYGGTGMDFNIGYAKGIGVANGDVTPVLCTGGSCGPGRNLQLQAQANLDASSLVTPVTVRAFGGFQINVSHLSFYAQVDKEVLTELVSAAAGIRLFY